MKTYGKNIIRRLVVVWVLLFSASAAWGSLLPQGVVMQEAFQPGYGYAVGAVQLVQGEVVIVHEGELNGYWAQNDLPLFKGDTIITLEKGRIRLKLNDESLITLASNTKLEIAQSVYDPQHKVRSSFINMVLGKARFFAKKIADFRRSSFKVKSLTAVIGVRGSEWVQEVTEDSTRVSTGPDTTLEVVPSAALEEVPTVLEAFQETIIEEGRLPSEAVDITPEEYEQRIMPFEMPEQGITEAFLQPQPTAPKAAETKVAGADVVRAAVEAIRVPQQELVYPEAIETLKVDYDTLTLGIIREHEIVEQIQNALEQQTEIYQQQVEQIINELQPLPELPPPPG